VDKCKAYTFRYLVGLLLFLLPELVSAQSNFIFRYKEVCSEEQKQISLSLDFNNTKTYSFFGETRTFTSLEIANNVPIDWLEEVHDRWKVYYPCAEIREVVATAAKSTSENADIDISSPIIIVASDLGYKDTYFTTSAGVTSTNVVTREARGYAFNFNTGNVSSIGVYRLRPQNKYYNSIVNANLIILQKDILASLTTGIYRDKSRLQGFLLHNTVFGRLNGFRFQDNSFILGTSYTYLKSRLVDLNLNVITSYTYRVKVFKLNYWFEDHFNVSPYFNLTYNVTPTFGLNLMYTRTLRYDRDKDIPVYTKGNYGILLGGRVFF
tara:strand:+ start:1201 stop:2169 length:969 start_codon:yes stop_codon:yes gene_type:complete